MLASIELLRRCEQLKTTGYFDQWDPPVRIARGYADLGYEEFLLLPGGRLVSLVGGAGSEFPEGHKHLFFQVPGVQEMVERIDRLGFDIADVRYQHQRRWCVEAHDPKRCIRLTGCHEELECALCDILSSIAAGK